MPDISVIVPARADATMLGRCLGYLCEQTLDPARYEICVVDNGASAATPKVIDLVRAHYPRHMLVAVSDAGNDLSRARNAGIAATRGALIASIASDSFASADWLARYVAAFAALGRDTARIGGEVAPAWGAPRPEWLTDALLPSLGAGTGLGGAARFVGAGLTDNNCCYRRAALTEAGGFPAGGGKKEWLASSDQVIDQIIRLNGGQLYFDPSITVQHNIPAARITPLWFRRHYFWQGVCDWAAQSYLIGKGMAEPGQSQILDLPLESSAWYFVNNANTPPTEKSLNQLRSLGFVLARTGFMPLP